MIFIERSLTIRCPPERAFRVWTERIHPWWPSGHRMTSDPPRRLVYAWYLGTSDLRPGSLGVSAAL